MKVLKREWVESGFYITKLYQYVENFKPLNTLGGFWWIGVFFDGFGRLFFVVFVWVCGGFSN